MGQCHQMPHKGEGGLAKVSCDIFSKILSHIFVFWPAFSKGKASFFENQNVTSHRGLGGSASVSPNDTLGSGGSKIGHKSVTYYLNDSLTNITNFRD